MSNEVSIRPVQIKDARRFLEILNSRKFQFFSASPVSLQKEKEILRAEKLKMKNGTKCSFSILLGDKVIGGVSIKINIHRRIVGEMGYFLDEEYWGQGITSEAVRLMEKIGFEILGLKRIEILMMTENAASKRVAEKCGYTKEALLRGAIMDRMGEMRDTWMYAKTIKDYREGLETRTC